MHSAPLFVRLQVIFARVCYNDSVTTPGLPAFLRKGGNPLQHSFFGLRDVLRRLTRSVFALGLAAAILLPAPRVSAGASGWELAASAISGLIAYKSTLDTMLDIGNNANYQRQSLLQDRSANGTDANASDVRAVDNVMQRLTADGMYVLPANNLPFTWHVNNSALFNAACYPTDYISVNRGLVRVLGGNEAELAAVLGHEMTHGLAHHSAETYAKTMAAYYGLSLLNMATGVMDWQQLQALTAYSSAKLFTLPKEYEADEGGFYLAARAGFNPGGGAAAMARMDAYLSQQSRNFEEYQDPEEQKRENYNDHPDTLLREKRLLGLLTDYSAGHVTVRERKTVCIDGKELLTGRFTAEDYDDTAENADLLAGELGRLFHDEAQVSGWGFVAGKPWADQRAPLLTEAVAREGLTAKLSALVHAAYAGEAASGAREKLVQREQQQAAESEKARQALEHASEKDIKRMRMNSDIYSDYGDSDKALALIDRAISLPNLDDRAESLAIRGRALAVRGDFAAALHDADAGCAQDAKNAYNFLNRADIYWMKGDRAAALADCARAAEADEKNPYSYLMSGMLYDEQGDRAQALASYRKLHEVAPKLRRIPDEYLKEIDPAALAQIEKERAAAKKAAAEKKQQEEKERKEQKRA